MIVYKIRSIKSGQYSTGGSHPKFTKNGKIWKSKQALSLHYNLLTPSTIGLYKSANVEIKTYEVIQTEIETISIDTWISENIQRQKQAAAKELIADEKYKKAQRKLEYEILKKEFE